MDRPRPPILSYAPPKPPVSPGRYVEATLGAMVVLFLSYAVLVWLLGDTVVWPLAFVLPVMVAIGYFRLLLQDQDLLDRVAVWRQQRQSRAKTSSDDGRHPEQDPSDNHG